MYNIIIEGSIKAASYNLRDAMDILDALDVPGLVRDADTREIVYIPDDVSIHTPIEDMDLSVRAYNILKRNGINTFEEAFHKYGLANLRNMGLKSLAEIRSYADAFHVELWSDQEESVEMALYGLSSFATARGVEIQDIPEWEELQEEISFAVDHDEPLPMETIRAAISTISKRIQNRAIKPLF